MTAYDLYKPPLCWTSEPPTVPGWYWHRLGPRVSQQVVYVNRTGEVFRVDSVVPFPMEAIGGEWAGPLVPPGGTP